MRKREEENSFSEKFMMILENIVVLIGNFIGIVRRGFHNLIRRIQGKPVRKKRLSSHMARRESAEKDATRKDAARKDAARKDATRTEGTQLSARTQRIRQQQVLRTRLIIGTVAVVLVVGSVFIVKGVAGRNKIKKQEEKIAAQKQEEETKKKETAHLETMAQAEKLSAGYDYDAAIALLKADPKFETDTDMKAAVAKYESAAAACVPADVTKITHVFFHTMVVEPEKAFFVPTAGSQTQADGNNQVMTTLDEFNKIMQQMYDRGYVIVRFRDMVEETKDADGTVHYKAGKIMLPAGKKPFVISQDDVSYYHFMEGAGYASRLIVGEDGKPTNEMDMADGTTKVGSFDMVPLLDDFIEAHPDFSYRGAKGLLALTGYQGILGYRTDPQYKTGEKLNNDQQKYLDEHPDFDYDKEVAEAKKVAQAIKDDGWEFASHSWGHQYYGKISLENLKTDAQKWEERVEPIIGDCDTIIYAFGDDIADWKGYENNERYDFLKSLGFNFFANVDSNQYWSQIADGYVRQGRRNLDGYRMYYDLIGETNKVGDLFDVKSVFDSRRPTPVKQFAS